ncbi:hypothetical protein XBKQ1_2750001 [Xenorhabdus bovienii str. kraussei Quebec]|uniref:Uncharacterized protein n=1 Tax=Xenorhabdus bovienii str. kraussei Quebec TaxID=1398203 RepID=A0A077PLT7_XENBV|nr:hypothetical protein XBKQ1_2750001 [Xenorhabdus bovienii str. kraussei Quebec]
MVLNHEELATSGTANETLTEPSVALEAALAPRNFIFSHKSLTMTVFISVIKYLPNTVTISLSNTDIFIFLVLSANLAFSK